MDTRIRAIITGATGMVGEGVLIECLQHPQVAQLRLSGRAARVTIEKTLPGDWRSPRLHDSLDVRITER